MMNQICKMIINASQVSEGIDGYVDFIDHALATTILGVLSECHGTCCLTMDAINRFQDDCIAFPAQSILHQLSRCLKYVQRIHMIVRVESVGQTL